MINFAGFMKITGIVLAGFVAFMGGLTGVLYVTGGFEEEYIEPTGIIFEYNTVIIDDDTDIFCLPENEDGSSVEIELKIEEGSEYIELPETAELKKPITVVPKRNEEDAIIGGEARVRATYGFYVAYVDIFVDIPLDSFEVGTSNEESIYVGDTFNVLPENVYPLNALNPATKETGSAFDLGEKEVRYYSSNEDVATVDEFTGEVNVLYTSDTENSFSIEARVIKTYNLLNEIPNLEDPKYFDGTYYDYDQYNLDLDAITTIASREFIVQDIAVEGVTAVSSFDDPLHDIYLHKQNRFTIDDFGLELLPQADSDFTSAQLEYKMKDADLFGISVSNDNVLEATIDTTGERAEFVITVKEFETWEIQHTAITFEYKQFDGDGEEIDPLVATVYFKIQRNNIVDMYIVPNETGAIQLTANALIPETFDLDANTVLVAENNNEEPTYTRLVYEVDEFLLYNSEAEGSQLIVSVDETSRLITDGILTPLNRGNTRVRAIVVETDMFNRPIVQSVTIEGTPISEGYDYYIDAEGNVRLISSDDIAGGVDYYVYKNIFTSEYMPVNVLEELKTLDLSIKAKKTEVVNKAETIVLTVDASKSSPVLINAFKDGTLNFESEDPTVAFILNTNLDENDNITLTIRSAEHGSTDFNAILDDNGTLKTIDTFEINVLDIDSEGLTYTQEFDFSGEDKTTFIKSREGVLLLTPNSYGAFVDAYLYDKIEFVTSNPSLLDVRHSIDANNKITVEILAIDYDSNPAESYSFVECRLKDDPTQKFFSQDITLESGAVEQIRIINNVDDPNDPADIPTIGARVSGDNEVQWLIPEGNYNENMPLELGVQFLPDTFIPRITDVDYYAIDWDAYQLDPNTTTASDVMYIDNTGDQLQFTFYKAGMVVIRAESLDTDSPNFPVTDICTLRVVVPQVTSNFVYEDLYEDGDDDYEQIIAGLSTYTNNQLDLLNTNTGDVILTEPRISAEDDENQDVTNILKFEVLQGNEYITLTEVAQIDDDPATPGVNEFEARKLLLETSPVGAVVTAVIRVYTDFGFEELYNLRIAPDVIATLTYPDNTNPEIVYESTSIDLDLVEDLGTAGTAARVVMTDSQLNDITNLTYEIYSSKYISNGADTLAATIGYTSGLLNVGFLSEPVEIIIKITTGFGYSEYYTAHLIPDIDIVQVYNNGVVHPLGEVYEEVNASSTIDLVATGRVSAETINPDNVISDITNELRFELVGYTTNENDISSNDYIQVNNLTGEITTLAPSVEQWVQIKVYHNLTGYTEYYNVKILPS